jgi:SAM-dependent methyltransferase
MSGLINWELLLDMLMPPKPNNTDLWDAFASRYDGFSKLEAEYTQLQINAMNLAPYHSLLDVGAGPGRLTIPASRKVAWVTAMDSSDAMLELLRHNAAEANRHNLSTLNMAWNDVRPGENIALHDVVIASRSPAMRDLDKLDKLAKKHVYLLFFAGPSLKNLHDELMADICPTPPDPPPAQRSLSLTAVVFNRLCDMGIDACVQYVKDGFTHWYDSRDSLFADFSWLPIPEKKQAQFKRNIQRYVTPENRGFRFRKETKTVIISWTKE